MKKFILVLIMMFFATKAFAFEPPGIPADIALQKLKEGNDRFIAYQMKHPNQGKERRQKLVNGQHPFAVIVCCSDSRVPPEIIFDQGLGDLFVIRNAGNVIDEHVMGSLEYAVHHLGVNLIIVLGHESCGAVGAAMKEETERPDIESIKACIEPAVKKCKEDNAYSYENIIKTHAKMDVDNIFENKELKEYSMKHDLKILPAYYSITTGKVEILK